MSDLVSGIFFAYELNRWYGYALSADGDFTRIYVDCELVGEQWDKVLNEDETRNEEYSFLHI
ncbi:hypothetical protein ACFL6S_07605 [Candidatus Poribacteria bacterium]